MSVTIGDGGVEAVSAVMVGDAAAADGGGGGLTSVNVST